MSTSPRDRIATARAQARAAGKRLPVPGRKVPRQRFPWANEKAYTDALTREVEAWGREVTAAIADAYPGMLARRGAAHRVDSVGHAGGGGGWADELHRILGVMQARWGARAARLAPTVAAIARKVADFSYAQTQHQFRAVLGVDVLGAEPWLAGELHAYGLTNAGLIKSIGDQAVVKVERAVADAVQRGRSTADLKNAVREELGTGDQRARLIARDQVGKLNGQLTRIRHERAGITKYRWRGMLDLRERQAHRVREGRIFSYDNPPPDGNPGEPVQCRCVPEPVLDEFADLMPERPAPDWEAIGRPPRERRRWGGEYDRTSAREMDEQAARRPRPTRGGVNFQGEGPVPMRKRPLAVPAAHSQEVVGGAGSPVHTLTRTPYAGDLQNSQAFRFHNAQLNAEGYRLRDAMGGRWFLPQIKSFDAMHSNVLRERYLDIWGGDAAGWQEAQGIVRKYAFHKGQSVQHQALGDAFKRIMHGQAPTTAEGEALEHMLATRRQRWERLAASLGVDVPDTFTVYRGLNGRKYVESVAGAWRAGADAPLTVQLRELTSWSLNRNAAGAFATEYGKNAAYGVIAEARFPFDMTVADKWVDDSAYIVPWAWQDEVTVGSPVVQDYAIDPTRAIVYFQGQRYTYAEREAFLAAWDLHQP
jgi:SPP1 gp7 family putative phage head morphogenesis protein